METILSSITQHTEQINMQPQNIYRELQKYDIISLNTIMRRQYYVLKDLYKIYDKYPNLLDGDLIGSLDALFRAMCDMTDSLSK